MYEEFRLVLFLVLLHSSIVASIPLPLYFLSSSNLVQPSLRPE
jgi:hypothetical protein